MRGVLASAGTLAITAALTPGTHAAPPPRDGSVPSILSLNLPYEVIDGLAVHDGDMVLGTVEELARRTEAADPRGWRRRDLALADPHYTVSPWPGGVVPYVIDQALPEGAAESARTAIEEWNAKTVVSLVPRTDEEDYVRFVPSDGCYANLGKKGGEQFVWSGREGVGCGPGGMAHEIGHAIGLHHEHQRADRDERLMATESSLSGEGAQWVWAWARPAGAYDYRSTMHYQERGFETIPPGIELPSGGLSEGDVDGVARLYGQPPTATTIATNPPGLEVLVDGIATKVPARFDWPAGTVHTIEVSASPQEREGSRYLFGRWNDGAPRKRTATAGEDGTWLEANFIAQRLVSIEPDSTENGEVSVAPASGGWHTLRSRVRIEAKPRLGSGMRFMNWSWAQSHGPAVNPAETAIRGERIDTLAYFTAWPAFRLGANAQAFRFYLNGELRMGPLSLDVAGFSPSVSVRVDGTQGAWGEYRSRYRFERWSDGVEAAEREIALPAGGGSLDAVLAVEHLLESVARPPDGGTVTASPASADGFYSEGAEVALAAVPAEGWEFAGWTGGARGDAPVSARMAEPRAIDAWFTRTRQLRPGSPEAVTLPTEAAGFRFAAPPGASGIRVRFAPGQGTAATDLLVRAASSPLEAGLQPWERLHAHGSGRHRLLDADFASESTGAAEEVAISFGTVPPLDPGALYFVALVSDAPASGTLSLEVTDSGPAPPRGRAWPRAFTFVSDAGADPAPQAFALRNDGGSAMRFEASSEAAWLSADPPQGSVAPGESAEISVQVTGLVEADTHEGTLAIALNGPAGPASPLALPVTFVAVPAASGSAAGTATN